MNRNLAAGITSSRRIVVDASRTIGFMGDALRVYATPAMLRDVETICTNFLGEFLTPEENSVGARVEIDHLGPTLNGMSVDITATIARVDGRRIEFEIEVRDELDVVGRAKHTRFVVDLARQRERLDAKATRLAALEAQR